MKTLLIFILMLVAGVAGITVICTMHLPLGIGAPVCIVSIILGVSGALGIWACLDSPEDDDDDGPHFYGPGGTII